MVESIYWYDFETTGIDSIQDRAIQFAGVRTDLELNVIDEPLNVFCMPGDDTLPSPEAMLVTGIKMSDIAGDGLTEAEFCQRILAQFEVPQTCVAGYNSIRFDDEFARQMLYRNFFEPYAREWQGGNSRWDVIDMFRMAYAFRPQGLSWPTRENGMPSFRLELLTEANGIAHDAAHDAVSDVLATIKLAKLLRQKQPRLYAYLYQLRSKKQVLQQLYPLGKAALIHVSSMYPASRGCTSIVLPLCSHPTNSNGIICYDLSIAPDTLISASAEEVQRLVFTATRNLAEYEQRIPLKTLHINRCPAIAPLKTLTVENAQRLGLDMEACETHRQILQQSSGVVEKIDQAFKASHFPLTDDPDLMLYQGDFFAAGDLSVMRELRAAAPERLNDFTGRFQDERLDEMLFRYRARNYPQLLDADERLVWQRFKREKWDANNDLQLKLARTKALRLEKGELPCLIDLEAYLNRLSETI